MTKIERRTCGYYHEVPSWAQAGKAWCRMMEARIPADKFKTRCKTYRPDENNQ